MKCSTISTILLSAVGAMAAATPKSLQRFKVYTQVVSGPARFNNLWLGGTHTGAGEADPVFYKEKTDIVNYSLNGTQLVFDDGPGTYAYSFTRDYAPYAAWSPMRINIGLGGDKGFHFKRGTNQIIMTGDTQWRGWLVCDWYHLEPQLFWITDGATAAKPDLIAPSSCAVVKLLAAA